MFDITAIAAGLPVGGRIDELTEAVGAPGARVVVSAPPGAGKTTVVPAIVAHACAADSPGRPGRVVVTAPRRMAARAAARRLARLAGVRLGHEVGFTVRGESFTSGSTRVEFVTTGVLVNRLLRDPGLTGVGAVVLDEVHERGLDTDLAFAMCRDVADLREDLRLVVMSATLDTEGWAGLLGEGTRTVEVPDAPFELDLSYAPAPGGGSPTDRGHLTRDFAAHLAAVTAATARGCEGSVLVFVPTRRDVTEMLGRITVPGLPVVGLSGAQSPREQDAVLSGGGRRVVVATAVAESSLTVPGVRAVVDSGLSRVPRLDVGRGVQGLVTIRESRANAVQRAGRAARLGPGTAVRCFPAEDWAGMDARPTPQVQVAELSGAVLTLACWGDTRGAHMALPDPLPPEATERAVRLLRELGALDEDERVTEPGRRLARVPVEPRLARALLDGAGLVGPAVAGQVVAALATEGPGGEDLTATVRALASRSAPGGREWAHEARRLAALAGHRGPLPGGAPSAREVGLVAALAHPEWIARRRRDGRGWLTVSGTGADVRTGGPLEGHEWLAVCQLSRLDGAAPGASGSLVRSAAPIDEATALAAGPPVHELRALSWDRDSGRIRCRAERRLGAIIVSSAPCPPGPDEQEAFAVDELAARGLGLDGPGLLRWSAEALALRDRLAFLHRVAPGDWPGMSAEALAGRAPQWLAGRLRVCASTYDIDLAEALRGLLDWRQLAALDTAAPERLTVPSGSRVRVRYPRAGDDGPPVLGVKLQECFGVSEGPRIAGVPVLLELLSPARRPLALTDDLASFWAEVYPQVRAENRGRYPKHPWPQDPLTATPSSGTKRHGRRP